MDYETDILNFWKSNKINEKVDDRNKGGKLFSWVEGPPYPTGEAHLGHLRNWAIKDCVFRFHRFLGEEVYTKDGYDVHGLPVEQKVQTKLGIKDTKELKEEFGEAKFIDECRNYVSKIIDDMKEIRERYGLSIPKTHYQTSHKDYISMAWRFFKKAEEKNLLYKDYKCVAWSPALETTLSDYEIKDSYANLKDPSVYVRFKIREEFTSTKYDEYLLIWTTTPWTLEANQAIAINKNFEYSKVLVEDKIGKYVLVIAKELVEEVIEKLSKKRDIKLLETLQTFSGDKIVGINYEPLYLENETQKKFLEDKNYLRVVHADFVSLSGSDDHLQKLQKKSFKHDGSSSSNNEEIIKPKKVLKEGTGLAHEAPAHGIDDFELLRKEGFSEVYCIVDEKGNMIDESKYKGINFRDSNELAINYLEEQNLMLYSDWKHHNYPLCWRSKVPIVYRTCQQWYIKRSSLINDMIIENNKKVKWTPSFAKDGFNNLLSNAGDWAISRQRFWGIPMPVFENEEKDKYIVVGSLEELENLTKQKFDDLHKDKLQNVIIEKDGVKYYFTNYVCDVWFDSGCASFASHYGEGLSFDEIIKKYYPMSWITEGEDQMRGWFSSLFNVGYLTTGVAPYNEVLFYRFVMDKNGVKMSKSLGNGISGNEAIEKWGADISRFYLLSKIAPEEQLNFDFDEIKEIKGFFNTLENSIKFVNNYLEKHQVKHFTLNFENLNIEDKWILYKLNYMNKIVKDDLSKFRFNFAIKQIVDFVDTHFSKTYLKIVKDRCDNRDENIYIIFEKIIKDVLILLSNVIPFKCEKLYSKVSLQNKKESIFFESYPYIDDLIIDKCEKNELDNYINIGLLIVQNVLNLREKSKIGLRWPLYNIEVFMNREKQNFDIVKDLILNLTNVKRIEFKFNSDFEYEIKPDFLNIKLDFKEPKNVIDFINSNKDLIKNSLNNSSKIIDEGDFKIDLDKHIIKQIVFKKDEVSQAFDYGIIKLDNYQDETLIEEGFFNEIKRRVQDIRKDKKLSKEEFIQISFNESDDYLIEIVKMFQNKLKEKCQIKEILEDSLNEKFEFKIKDKGLVVSLN